MPTNLSIKLSDFDSKDFPSNHAGTEGEAKAVITHFIQNNHDAAALKYKADALAILNLYADYKSTAQQKVTPEEALRQFTLEVQNIPFPAPQNPTFKFIDLFAGVGGFRIALQKAGGKCVYTSEWNKQSQKTYQANFGETPFGDITRPSVKNYIPEKFDILCAGFPCQAFSIAGYRKGFSDTRGTLFFDVEEIIQKHRPKAVFLENVKNLVSHDKGRTFRVIIEILEQKLGYRAFYKVMNSMDHADVPQNRERIFIVAFDKKQVHHYQNFGFPEEIKLTRTIHDFIDPERQPGKYYYSEDHAYYPELLETMTKRDTVYQWRRVYVRENKSNVCPTLTANMGAGGHNVPLIKDGFGLRKLTPKECFAFQGYPMEKFILPPLADSSLYMQAGNSVTTSLIERIARNIVQVMQSTPEAESR